MTKIKISYTDDTEKEIILRLLEPFLKGKRVKDKDNKGPYKHVYITPKNQ